MNKHTPGPWTAGTSLIDGKEMFTACESRDTRRVMAITGTCGRPDEIESIANTRLIAASPDLLSLHKKHMELMMEIAQELKNPRLPLGTTVEASIRMLAEAAKESLEAIAKATGETP